MEERGGDAMVLSGPALGRFAVRGGGRRGFHGSVVGSRTGSRVPTRRTEPGDTAWGRESGALAVIPSRVHYGRGCATPGGRPLRVSARPAPAASP